MEEELPQLRPGEVMEGVWMVEKKLGEGGFGAVYKVKNVNTGDLGALKVEGLTGVQLLKMEVVVLSRLRSLGKNHVCKLLAKGRTRQLNYIIMTLVGKSLQDLKENSPGGKLSLSSALRIGSQCLEAIMDLHNIDYLHRDIKPGNFAVGREEVGEHRNVVVLDFGMAKKFTNDRGEYRTPRAAASFRGTPRYAPLCCHKDVEQGRKDDLESWFYQQVEITVGRLPWHNISDIAEIGRVKVQSRHNGQLYAGCPGEYPQILGYIDTIHMVDKPDYARIGKLLRQAMNKHGILDEHPYDWEKPAAPAAPGALW